MGVAVVRFFSAHECAEVLRRALGVAGRAADAASLCNAKVKIHLAGVLVELSYHTDQKTKAKLDDHLFLAWGRKQDMETSLSSEQLVSELLALLPQRPAAVTETDSAVAEKAAVSVHTATSAAAEGAPTVQKSARQQPAEASVAGAAVEGHLAEPGGVAQPQSEADSSDEEVVLVAQAKRRSAKRY
eukprot:TRINITY_DN3031_c1_g1_i12.p2 TRINITY_DN3031_c1_g1~~TRINITY_DN3031_c1_g1_i12.p2  ORF type:complete len:186 (+),score=40.07 TRINITY_DN3031_c1_g1_i12:1999-2556(+)